MLGSNPLPVKLPPSTYVTVLLDVLNYFLVFCIYYKVNWCSSFSHFISVNSSKNSLHQPINNLKHQFSSLFPQKRRSKSSINDNDNRLIPRLTASRWTKQLTSIRVGAQQLFSTVFNHKRFLESVSETSKRARPEILKASARLLHGAQERDGEVGQWQKRRRRLDVVEEDATPERFPVRCVYAATLSTFLLHDDVGCVPRCEGCAWLGFSSDVLFPLLTAIE